MSTPLPKDREIHPPSVMIVSASAGAGKTHTLALRLVQFLLSTEISHTDPANILAITFTNTAAAEMRHRVLNALKSIALDRPIGLADHRPFRQSLLDILSCDAVAAQLRARLVVEKILERYSDFQIRTIDSFMGRVYKAVALEMGFRPDVDVVMSGDAIAAAALDRYLASHPEGDLDALEELLRAFDATGAARRGFVWNPYAEALRGVQELLERTAAEREDPAPSRKSAELVERVEEFTRFAGELRRSYADVEDVVNKNFQKQVEAAAEGEWLRLLSRTRIAEVMKKAAGAGARDRIVPMADRFYATLGDLALLQARTRFEMAVTSLQSMGSDLRAEKQDRGEVVISDIARHLVGFLREEVVPQIYVTLGEKIFHYLLDEFQDTSPIQWEALHPLIENALATDGTLFCVGDTKQSIFGFRGADWRIMKGLTEGTRRFPSASLSTPALTENWRSGGKIVRFVEEVFHKRTAGTPFAHAAQQSGLTSYQQRARREDAGHVEVIAVPRDDDAALREAVLALLDSAHERNHPYGNIAILTPANSTVIAVSGWLNERGIPFVSHSSLDIRTRTLTSEILALLRFLVSPVEDHAFATVVLGQCVAGFAREEGLDADILRQFLLDAAIARGRHPLYVQCRERFPGFWERSFKRLLGEVGYLPLYDLVVLIIKTFSLFDRSPEESSGLVQLLDVVKDFEGNGANGVRDFLLQAGDEADEGGWSIERSADPDAVTIMTVHKSKGLEYPVVIAVLPDKAIRAKSAVFTAEDGRTELWSVTKDAAQFSSRINDLYEEERTLATADRLNQLYVCLTRAREELYVVSVRAPEVKEDATPFPSTLLGPPWASAEHRPAAGPAEPHDEQLRLPPLFDAPVRRALPGRTTPVGFWVTRRGDLFHRVLGRITEFSGAPDEPLDHALKEEEGISPVAEVEAARPILLRFLSRPDVAALFAPRVGRTVVMEQEMVSNTGLLLRTDRVVVDEKEVLVIDFKTGRSDHAAEYLDQVRRYMQVLSELHPGKKMRGLLAYVDEGLLDPVGLPGEER